MRKKNFYGTGFFCASILILVFAFTDNKKNQVGDDRFLSYTVDASKARIEFYFKDDSDRVINNFKTLKSFLEKKNLKLKFAMNGGMFKTDFSPLGLFIQQQKLISALNTNKGEGNFYLKPNGVFYITTDNKAMICRTSEFKNNGKIKYATQSGPMLVVDGAIHPVFKKGSTNLNIRNGVGILPGNKIIFAISKEAVSFYDFAEYFKNMNCRNALYLDGFVSQIYLPEKNPGIPDGNFGVIIGETE